MSNSKPNNQPGPPQPQQYHYLYGSVDDPPQQDGGGNGADAQHQHHHGDEDSLEGEGLIPTDNENEDGAQQQNRPLLDERDLQQMMMTTDGGGSGTNGGGGTGGGRIMLLPNHFGSSSNGTSSGKLQTSSALTALLCCGRGNDNSNQNGSNGGEMFLASPRRSCRERHPTLYNVAWFSAVAVFGCCVAAVIFPNSRIAKIANSGPGGGGAGSTGSLFPQFVMPFESVSRDGYNDPVSNIIETDLIDPSLVGLAAGKSSATGAQPTFAFPFPTGAFWTNLVLPPTADRGLSYPVAVYPYAYKWSDEVLQVSYPAAHRKQEPKAIHDYFFPDLTFGVAEEASKRHVTAFDALSVTLQYLTADTGKWETYLVQGSPYITINYSETSPTIRAFSIFDSVFCPRDDEEYSQLIDDASTGSSNQGGGGGRHRRLDFGICHSEQNDNKEVNLRGVQFIIKTQEGNNWMVFSSEPIELIYDSRVRTKITSRNKFNGVLRLVLLPSLLDASAATFSSSAASAKQGSNNAPVLAGSTGLQRLIYHAGVYPTSGSVSWTFHSADSAGTNLKEAAAKIMGVGGMGLVPPSSSNSGGGGSSSTTTTSTTPGTTSGVSSRIATLSFQFSTKTFSPTSSTTTPVSLLMLALPHHAQSLPATSQFGKEQFDLVFRCIKGPMRPVVGSTWTYDEPLPQIGFDKYNIIKDAESSSSSSPQKRKEYMNPVVRAEIVKSLNEDIKLALPTLDENIYGFGKQTARLAQIAHIAHEMTLNVHATARSGHIGNATTSNKNSSDSSNVRSSSSSSSSPNQKLEQASPTTDEEDKELTKVHDHAVELLANALEHLLSSNVSDTLVYDNNLGGMVTVDGLWNKEADFGNGRYNDHHFHYGYILYACAILGKIDSTFVEKYGSRVDALYYDVAYDSNFAASTMKTPSTHGIFFPGARHKMWFDGHSFASGLFPFGNGKSQESSSEAVNCYYGAYLWSLVRQGYADHPELDMTPHTDFARLLLATEIRGAQFYWHMQPPDSSSSLHHNKTAAEASTIYTVYNAEFSKNYMVGNLGMLDVIASTWFGTEPLYVHLINEIPITAITEDLFDKSYVKKEYSQILGPLGEVEMAWQGYLVCNHAIVDSQKAWKEAVKLFSPELDSALSKSEVLYWVATRPGFNATLAAENTPELPIHPTADSTSGSGGSGSGSVGDSSSSCSAHPACSQLGLTGECCPTSRGTKLDCCNN